MLKTGRFDVTFEITNQCDLHCRMCSIWKEKDSHSLRAGDIERFLGSVLEKNKINTVSLTGGEPFRHPQIGLIYKRLALLKFKNKIQSIGIYSNGYDTERILDFLKAQKGYIENLDLGVSLDGLEKNHVFLRGKKDSFRRTLNTIHKVIRQYPEVKVGVKFTINGLNYPDLMPLYEYCKAREIRFMPKLGEFHAKHYYHRLKCRGLDLAWDTKPAIRALKETLSTIYADQKDSKRKIVDDAAIRVLLKLLEQKKSFIKSCLTPAQFLFVDSRGDVFPCLYMRPLAPMTGDPAQKLFGPKHLRIISRAFHADCPACFAYHGFFKKINYRRALIPS